MRGDHLKPRQTFNRGRRSREMGLPPDHGLAPCELEQSGTWTILRISSDWRFRRHGEADEGLREKAFRLDRPRPAQRQSHSGDSDRDLYRKGRLSRERTLIPLLGIRRLGK